jgi:hypothetical protein
MFRYLAIIVKYIITIKIIYMSEKESLFARSLEMSYIDGESRCETYILPTPESDLVTENTDWIIPLDVKTIIPEIRIGYRHLFNHPKAEMVFSFGNPSFGGIAAVCYGNSDYYLLPGDSIFFPIDEHWITLFIVKHLKSQILQFIQANYYDPLYETDLE